MNDYRNFKAEDFLSDEFFMEWVLIAQPEHQIFWKNWLAENPDRAGEVQRAVTISKSLYVKPNDKQLTDDDVTAITDRFLRGTQVQPLRSFRSPARWMAAAAIIVLGIVSAIILFKQYKTPSATKPASAAYLVRVMSNEQQTKMLKLSDGTIVLLKAHSEISYPAKFTNNKREVFLKGEGFFEVTKNPAKPFMVHAGNMVTRVLGTSFTVSAYHGDIDFKVVVNTGRVQVYDKRKTADGIGEPPVVLTPNLMAVHARDLGPFKVSTLKVPLLLSPELAKKEFLFINTPVPAIISKLEQAYGVTINYNKTKYADVTVTASLSKLPLDEKLRAICKAIDAVCEFKDGNISIK